MGSRGDDVAISGKLYVLLRSDSFRLKGARLEGGQAMVWAEWEANWRALRFYTHARVMKKSRGWSGVSRDSSISSSWFSLNVCKRCILLDIYVFLWLFLYILFCDAISIACCFSLNGYPITRKRSAHRVLA